MHKEIVSSSLWMLAGNVAQQVMQFLVFILLARLLTPDIFGSVALASVFVEITCAIGMWGIIDFLTQRRFASRFLISHALIFSLALGALLSLIVVAGVGLYVWFNGMTLVPHLVLLLVPIILAQAAGIVPEATIRRGMNFRAIAMRNNLAALVGGAVAVAMAFAGFGVYALVAQKLIALGIMAASVWIVAGKNVSVLPLRAYRWTVIRSILREGAKISSNRLSNLISFRLVDGVVGLFLGLAALGQFKIIIRVYEMLIQLAITPVSLVAYSALPKFSREPGMLSSVSRRMIETCGLVFVPMLAGLGVTAAYWVPLVLGEQWLGTVPSFQILAFASVATVYLQFQIPTYLALQKNTILLTQSVLSLISATVLCTIAAQFTIEAVVGAFVANLYIFMLYNAWHINRMLGIGAREDLRMVWPALSCTAAMVAAIAGLSRAWSSSVPAIDLAVLICCGVAVYAGLYLLCFRRRAMETIAGAKSLLRKSPEGLTEKAL